MKIERRRGLKEEEMRVRDERGRERRRVKRRRGRLGQPRGRRDGGERGT